MNLPGRCLLACFTAGIVLGGDAPPVPEGTVFHHYGLVYLAGSISFTDVSSELWPNHFYAGKGTNVQGTFTFTSAKPSGGFTLTCPKLVQPGDGFPLRILGERMSRDKAPEVRFTLRSLGPWLDKPPAGLGDPAKAKPFEWCSVEGVIAIEGSETPLTGDARIGYTTKGGGGGLAANTLLGMSVNLRCFFTVTGKQLGLEKQAAKSVRITVESHAYTEATLLEGAKKKTLSELGIGSQAPARLP